MLTNAREPRVRAVILDWAGTAVDFGSRAPVLAFVRTFAEFGVTLTEQEARGPMGLAKREHIQALCRLPRIADEWRRMHGRDVAESDVDALYQVFNPLSAAVVAEHATPVPGAIEVVSALRRRRIAIGSTTGYSRAIMAELVPRTRAAGFAPDCVVSPDDVAVGRPSPLMMYRCFLELGVWPASACIKIDDTVPGIVEGLAAGSWAVGVSMSGNTMGLSERQVAELEPAELEERLARGRDELLAAGAHAVIRSIADLLPIVDAIETALEAGMPPQAVASSGVRAAVSTSSE